MTAPNASREKKCVYKPIILETTNPSHQRLSPDLSARQFLDYIGILKGMEDGGARRRRVEELLETVGLADVASRKLKTFSGGMKRRVGIAQALLNDPRLVIVDEPTAGLDPEERIRFRNLLSELAGDRMVLLSSTESVQ